MRWLRFRRPRCPVCGERPKLPMAGHWWFDHAGEKRLANRCDLGSVESATCRFGPHEWQGSFIGERFCYTHGGHSVAETPGARCPRADA